MAYTSPSISPPAPNPPNPTMSGWGNQRMFHQQSSPSASLYQTWKESLLFKILKNEQGMVTHGLNPSTSEAKKGKRHAGFSTSSNLA